MDCLLCVEERDIFSFGECGHFNVCFVCAHKMRTKLGNNKCAVCNVKFAFLQNRTFKFADTDRSS